MSRFSLSPKLTTKSPRNTNDIFSNQEKLPSIKIRKSTIPFKIEYSHSDPKIEDNSAKIKPQIINYFDIPSPVDQKKLEIVRSTLEKRKRTLPVNKDLRHLEESIGTSRADLVECQTELNLQIEFLHNKNFKKHFLGAAEKGKGVSHSIELNRIQGLLDNTGMKNSDSEFIEAFQKAEVSEEYLVKSSETSEIVNLPVYRTGEPELKTISNTSEAIPELTLQKNTIIELSNHNSELQFLLDEAKSEISVLLQEKLQISSNLDKSTQEFDKCKHLLESQVQLLHGEITLKTQDCDILRDQLKKSEFNRKKFAEALKDTELDLILIKKEKDYLYKDMEDLKQTCQDLEDENKAKREKLMIVDELQREIERLKYELGIVKDESKESFSARDVAKESLEVVRKNFDNSRLAWRDKEANYEKIIENLLDQVSSERAKTAVQAAEVAKLRKALVLKDNDSVTNFAKDESQRCQTRLMQLDKENGEALGEIEKLKKNTEYYMLLLKSKQEVIEKLINENKEYERKEKRMGLEFSEENLGNIRKFFNNWMKCQKCLMGVCISVISPCKHLVCSKCEPEENQCTVCSVMISEVKVFTEFNKIRNILLLFEDLNPV